MSIRPGRPATLRAESAWRPCVAAILVRLDDALPVRAGVAINHEFKIPPDEKNYKVEASWTVEEPAYAISVFPHMHLLGKEMKVTATLPDGTVEPLLWI